jgi:hypothetical protein
VTLTPLDFDMTNRGDLAGMQSWQFSLENVDPHDNQESGQQ